MNRSECIITPGQEDTRNMSILEREIALYESHRSEFEKDHESEWVVISGDEIAGFFPGFSGGGGNRCFEVWPRTVPN